MFNAASVFEFFGRALRRAGIVIIPSAILGVLCGGLLARRFSTDVIRNARLLVSLIIVSMLGLASLMFVSCQRVLVPGVNTDYDAALAPRYLILASTPLHSTACTCL